VLNAETGDYNTVSITISNSEGISEHTVRWDNWIEALVGVNMLAAGASDTD